MKRLFVIATGLFLLLGCRDQGPKEIFLSGEALGTTYNIKYFSEEPIRFEEALDSIIENVNASMSTYIPDSDISRINDGDTSVVVDENFIRVFQASDKIYKESQGVFDPTVGVLVNAYGFGPDKALKELDSLKLDSLKRLVGFDNIRLTTDQKIQKSSPAVYLDFNAIAKGFTIDLLGEYLEAKKVDNYLIELGGELRARGINLEKDSTWIVGIDDPAQSNTERSLKAILKLENMAMATSGNYRKFRIDSVTGEKFVHTINPISGKAVRSNLLSASVLADNCMLADGYATAFMALGLNRSKEMLSRVEGVEVYLIYSNENGEIEIYSSPGFQKQIIE
ncbi:FAD:protein FMN transferase [Christiangramia salexigens]|uniref:FAD:protein FMN transferase n=1 Tax=Christiangramia salexigens TaxID=1913577 RepID=A0A1L3J8H0_9FLAO|nr:FAD:protein FMN transferase [Christiangramia salexigens]APG61411.1 thiamine biosynthesis protein ApbE [Christiangramia salexigens]